MKADSWKQKVIDWLMDTDGRIQIQELNRRHRIIEG